MKRFKNYFDDIFPFFQFMQKPAINPLKGPQQNLNKENNSMWNKTVQFLSVEVLFPSKLLWFTFKNGDCQNPD